MPVIDNYRKSNYLQKVDVEPPLSATIDHCVDENVAPQGQPESIECVIYFKEDIKPFIGKITNLETIAEIAGDRNTDHWEGVQIILYHDKNVMFGRKKVGGIRVCAPGEIQRPQARPRTQQHNYGPVPNDNDIDPQDSASVDPRHGKDFDDFKF